MLEVSKVGKDICWADVVRKINELKREILEDSMDKHIIVLKAKLSKVESKQNYYSMREKSGISSLVDEYEIAYWKLVKKAYLRRLDMFETMKEIEQDVLNFKTDGKEWTKKRRQFFINQGLRFIALGDRAFNSLIIVVKKNGKVVIERKPDEDKWLTGVQLNISSRYVN